MFWFSTRFGWIFAIIGFSIFPSAYRNDIIYWCAKNLRSLDICSTNFHKRFAIFSRSVFLPSVFFSRLNTHCSTHFECWVQTSLPLRFSCLFVCLSFTSCYCIASYQKHSMLLLMFHSRSVAVFVLLFNFEPCKIGQTLNLQAWSAVFSTVCCVRFVVVCVACTVAWNRRKLKFHLKTI